MNLRRMTWPRLAGTSRDQRPAPVGIDGKPKRQRLDSLTGLRFFAALSVVFCHVGGHFAGSSPLSAAAGYGYVGVSFFFVLSGFVLTWSSGNQSARRFWWLRFSRIWPLQCLLTVFAFTAISGVERLPGPLGHVSELLLLQAWSPRQGVYFGGNGVSWSLSCEMFFYLLFPAVIGPLSRLRARGLAITAGVTLAVLVAAPIIGLHAGISAPDFYWLFFVFPPYRFGEFLLGMVLARAVALGARLPLPAASVAVGALGLAAVTAGVTDFTLRTGTELARPFVALLALPFLALAILGAATIDVTGHRWWLGSAPLRRLGEWSFALYLVHKPVFLLTTQEWNWWSDPSSVGAIAGFVEFVALALGVAVALHYGIERPVERRLRGLALAGGALPRRAPKQHGSTLENARR